MKHLKYLFWGTALVATSMFAFYGLFRGVVKAVELAADYPEYAKGILIMGGVLFVGYNVGKKIFEGDW